jgi:pimeloyl-ACP methyl ester carboxylesterase
MARIIVRKLGRWSRGKFVAGAVLVIVISLTGLLIYVVAGGPELPADTDAIIDDVMAKELPELVVGETGYATSGALRVWYERIAPPGPSRGTILLIMSTGADALLWPPRFVRSLVDAGYHVIRYDHRGTGMSDWVDAWSFKHPYSIADMAGDAIAVLDALDVQQAHVVGVSLGGMVAQEVAIQQPQRVSTLTLMMTSGYIGDPELPAGPTSRYLLASFVQGIPLLKYRLRGGVRNLIKERIAKYLGALGPDGLDVRETAEAVLYDQRYRRGINVRGVLQHIMAVTVSGSRYHALRSLDVPALIIHGTDDQFIPIEHGRKLVEVIPEARGVWLDGLGHVFPARIGLAIDDLLAHIAARSA